MCLNKKHPALPTGEEYRPLVVCSPVIKFLEGYLMPHLRRYGAQQLHRDQYAFIPQSSIELCKRCFFRTVLDRRR